MHFPAGFVLGFVVGTTCGVGCAVAQSFNIDFGDPAGGPGAGFAGPAGQAGVWNVIDESDSPMVGLVDLTGAGTGVAVESTLFMRETFHNSRPETSGEVAALMDDFFFLDGDVQTEIAFLGLQNGQYDLIVAAAFIGHPDEPTVVTWLSDDFSEFQEDVLGDEPYSGSFEQGVTHSRFRVPVRNGELRFYANGVLSPQIESFGNLNGVQLVLVPGPGAGAGVVVLAGLSRRRRGLRRP